MWFSEVLAFLMWTTQCNSQLTLSKRQLELVYKIIEYVLTFCVCVCVCVYAYGMSVCAHAFCFCICVCVPIVGEHVCLPLAAYRSLSHFDCTQNTSLHLAVSLFPCLSFSHVSNAHYC